MGRERALLEAGIDQEEQAGGAIWLSSWRRAFRCGGSAPVDPAWILAGAIFLDSVELTVPRDGSHVGATLFRRQAHGQESTVDLGARRMHQDGVRLAAVYSAADEAEGKAGDELEVVELVGASA